MRVVGNRSALWPEINYEKLRYGPLGGQHLNTLLLFGRTGGTDPSGKAYEWDGDADFQRWAKYGNRYVILSESTTKDEAQTPLARRSGASLTPVALFSMTGHVIGPKTGHVGVGAEAGAKP